MSDNKYEYTTIRTCPLKAILLNSSRNSHLNINKSSKFYRSINQVALFQVGPILGKTIGLLALFTTKKIEKMTSYIDGLFVES